MRLILLIAFLCVLAPAAAAPAASASGFVGMNLDGVALREERLPRTIRQIARTGAASLRWTVDWPAVQPHDTWADVPRRLRPRFVDVDGIPTDFTATDRIVRAAARARLDLLPVIMASAPWAAENPFVPFSPPADAARFGEFAATLARRYGPGGRFWRSARRIPRRPIRTWQVWNEPSGADGFGSPTWAWASERDALTGYLDLLVAARRSLKSVDPGARVVLSGLWGRSWFALEQLYGAGAQGAFDEVTIHPYTRRPRDVVRIARLVRGAMRRHGDGAKPLSITEFGWPTAAGRVSDPLTFAVTERQQAAMLRRGFRLLSRARHRLGLKAVYWYTWMSADASDDTWDYAGLLTRRNGRTTPKPALRAFRRVARRLNGAR